MKELFLIGALALPATHYKSYKLEEERPSKYEELKDLRRWIEEVHPGADVQIVPDGQKAPEMEKLPFTWGGMDVYITRKTVYDRSIRACG